MYTSGSNTTIFYADLAYLEVCEWNFAASGFSIVAIAPLELETRVCLAVQTDIVPVGEIAHQADQRLAAMPQITANPSQNAR